MDTKEIAMTVDVELWSKRKDYYKDIKYATPVLLDVSDTVPLSLFVSLSPKFSVIPFEEYISLLGDFIDEVKKERNISVHLHQHAKWLPINLDTSSDDLSEYTHEELHQLLSYGKEFFSSEFNVRVKYFRPGGFKIPDLGTYYDVLKKLHLNSSMGGEYDKIVTTASRFGVTEVPVPIVSKLSLLKYPFRTIKTLAFIENLSISQLTSALGSVLSTSERATLAIGAHSFLFYPDLRSAYILLHNLLDVPSGRLYSTYAKKLILVASNLSTYYKLVLL